MLQRIQIFEETLELQMCKNINWHLRLLTLGVNIGMFGVRGQTLYPKMQQTTTSSPTRSIHLPNILKKRLQSRHGSGGLCIGRRLCRCSIIVLQVWVNQGWARRLVASLLYARMVALRERCFGHSLMLFIHHAQDLFCTSFHTQSGLLLAFSQAYSLVTYPPKRYE